MVRQRLTERIPMIHSSITAKDVQSVYQLYTVVFSLLISHALEGRNVEVAMNTTSLSTEFNVVDVVQNGAESLPFKELKVQ